ncbi:HPP family protein [Pollutimonas bauzanensis]
MALAGQGTFFAIAGVGALAFHSHQPWIIASLGASCLLLFGFPWHRHAPR